MQSIFASIAGSLGIWGLTYVANCYNLVAKQEIEFEEDMARFPKANGDVVMIKALDDCSLDCDAVIDIWLSGLKQTSMSFGALSRIRRKLHIGLKQYGEKATAPEGDMNPSAIIAEWTKKEENGKKFFVAYIGNVVVGLCGVTRGCTQKGDDTDESIPSSTFSLWRMSVSPTARCMGVGSKLCEAVEDFARKHGGRRMRCITANPLAARFYQSIGFQEIIPHPIASWYEKIL